MCSYFSMLENKTIQIKHSISEFLFFGSSIINVKAFPAGAVSPDAKCISSWLMG